MPRTRRPKRPGGGRQAQRYAKLVVQRDLGKCHLCGHYGAKSWDHLTPCSEDESLFWDLANAKAAHAYPYGCTDCSYAAGYPIYCNEIRQDDPVEKGRARIAAKTGLKIAGDSPAAPEGREW
jgi:hypothetical protein